MGSPLQDYLAIVAQPVEQWNLFELGLELGRMIAPDADLDPYRRRLLALREELRRSLQDPDDPYDIINSANAVLFENHGFRGNREDYYDPENSFLTRVLDRRLGIPISLSLLYREVALGVGLELEPVGMPGHFLLRHSTGIHDLFVDAFNRGEILLTEECRLRLQSMYEGNMEFRAEFLQAVSGREVVLRALLNLKLIYRRRGDAAMLLEVLERRIPLLQDPLAEILERGLVHLALDNRPTARADLEHFLRRSSDDGMKAIVEKRLRELE